MFDWLFDTHSFVSRNHCGAWEPWLIAVNQFANLLIFIAYVSIPLSLLSLRMVVKRRPNLRKSLESHLGIILMFILFILACGFTHLMDVISFTKAPYRFFTLVDVITAMASIPTAILMPGVVRKILEANPDLE